MDREIRTLVNPSDADVRTHRLLLAATTAWCVAIAAAPMSESPWLHAFFSAICHQNPDRSWALGGESLAVCIRCASIYAGFLAGLVARIRANVPFLRISLVLPGLEFVVAHVWIDLEVLRVVSGLLLGMAASGLVEHGVRDLWAERARRHYCLFVGNLSLKGRR